MFGIDFETLQAFGYVIWARNAFTYRADGSGVYVCIPVEEFEAFADYVNKHLAGVDWARNAFTYRADGSGVYVCIPVDEFGHMSRRLKSVCIRSAGSAARMCV